MRKKKSGECTCASRRSTCASGRALDRACRAFTLLELLVVLVILGLLASLVGPQVMKHLSESKSKTAMLQIEEFVAALEVYYLDTGEYPTAAQGLAALVRAPTDLTTWNGPYLRKEIIRKDPWGREYLYRSPGEHGRFDLFSLGADGADGGEGENRDILSWE